MTDDVHALALQLDLASCEQFKYSDFSGGEPAHRWQELARQSVTALRTLAARVAELEGERDEFRDALATASGKMKVLSDERDQLRAQLAERGADVKALIDGLHGIGAELGMTWQETSTVSIRQKLTAMRNLLEAARCPNCKGEGFMAAGVRECCGYPASDGECCGNPRTEWEQVQCQWCDERRSALAQLDAPEDSANG